MDTYLFSFLSGFIQGITEFLPISSSGHLALLHNIFGFSDPHIAFDILLHSGTLAAVVLAYRREVSTLLRSAVSLLKKVLTRTFGFSACSGYERLCIMIVVSTLPLAAGVFFGDRLSALAASSRAVGMLLMLNAVILSAGDAAARRKGRVSLSDTKIRNAFLIGVLQLFAAAPGISRSGVTVTGGLFSGLSREDAVKYSFLISLPATLGANLLNLTDAAGAKSTMPGVVPCIIGTLTAAVTGFFAIRLIEKISKRTNFGIFSLYCFAAGAAAAIFG